MKPTDMYRTPAILFLVFNRPELAERVFVEIRNAKPAQLFIAADGPRPGWEEEVELCRRCRSLVDRVDWPCEVRTLFRSENLGCMRAVSEAITWFFANVEDGIILEDDCLPHPSFFPYCSILLNEYRHEQRVLSIGGSSLGFSNLKQFSYGFTSYMSMWGWASWADRAQRIDYSLRSWGTWRSKLRLLRSLQRGREKWGRVDYTWYKRWSKIFSDTKSGIENTWDYQWIYCGLMENLVSIFPSENLISNIGYGVSATHTRNANDILANIPTSTICFPLTHPKSLAIDKGYLRDCVQAKWKLHKPALKNDLTNCRRDLKSILIRASRLARNLR